MTTNKSAKAFLIHQLNIRNPIQVLYGGVDTEFFKPMHSSKRSITKIKRTFGTSDTIITYAGRVIWSKGITYLYKAFRDSISALPQNVYLIIAGPGAMLGDVRKEITKDHLENRIFITGSLDASKVRDLLQATDIFIHPSHHNEGFPNVILEAGATENLVIATANAGVEEAITDKKSGIIINRKDSSAIQKALLWAVNNKKQRMIMAHTFRVQIKNRFEWKKIADLYYKFLNRSIPA